MLQKQVLSPEQPCASELNWQHDADLPQRRDMIIIIHDLLKQGMNDPSGNWLKHLPQVANYLEQQLYRHASSLEEYSNGITLVERLNIIRELYMPPNPSWQSDAHLPQRRKMILKIIIILKKKRKLDKNHLDRKKVLQMANYIEHLIYRFAGSFEEYNKSITLTNKINLSAVPFLC